MSDKAEYVEQACPDCNVVQTLTVSKWWEHGVIPCDPCWNRRCVARQALTAAIARQFPKIPSYGRNQLARLFATSGMPGLLSASDDVILDGRHIGKKTLAAVRAVHPFPIPIVNGHAPIAGGDWRHNRLQTIACELLEVLGEDLTRDGLKETPRRFADWWTEMLDYDPGRTDVTFEAVSVDQLVLVKGITVWSVCEHHLLPFRAVLTIGYLAQDKVLGLSKFGRIAQAAAHKLQLQERLVAEIADEVQRIVGAEDVAVVGVGEHLCMTMRGIRMPAEMVTSVLRGRFREPGLRAELMGLAGR